MSKGLALSGLLWLVACAPGCSCEPDGWLAQISGLAGEVVVEPTQGAAARPARQGEHLLLGSCLRTGPASGAVLRLRGGGELQVKPESEVLLGRGEEQEQLQLTLARGTVESTGGEVATSSELVIAVGGRRVRLASRTRASISASGRPEAGPAIKVIYGAATLIQPGGEQEVMVAGAPLTLTLPSRGGEEAVDAALPVAGPDSAGAADPPLRARKTSRGRIMYRDGSPGTRAASFTVGGVKVIPRVTHRRVELRVTRDGEGSTLEVLAGEALLTTPSGTMTLEAGQEATLLGGEVDGPREPAPSRLTVSEPGRIRIFLPPRGASITLDWRATDGRAGSLVQVARAASMARPMFADVIRRTRLTLAHPRTGAIFWRVRPVDAAGTPGQGSSGQVSLLRDTSHRALRGARAPHNTIQEGDGNTTVYYQNRLPRFSLRWAPMAGAVSYKVKVLREQDLSRPVAQVPVTVARANLPAGRLGEGSYIWYAVGQDRSGRLVGSSKNRTLTIKYDNATPSLQIISPRDGLRVDRPTLEVKGVALRGTRVYIGGAEAPLDEASRFSRQVPLSPGQNNLIFRVVHPRSGTSLYLRRVTRRNR